MITSQPLFPTGPVLPAYLPSGITVFIPAPSDQRPTTGINDPLLILDDYAAWKARLLKEARDDER